MKTGRSLQEIASELERQVNVRKDYVAPQGNLTATVDEGRIVLEGLNGNAKEIMPYAHGQLSDNLGIPKKYYDRMLAEHPQLLADNVNTWLRDDADNARMVRTLDDKVRAFLSPKFRPLDNYPLADAILPTLMEHHVQVLSAELTETRLYIKGVLPELSEPVPDGMAWGVGSNRIAPYGSQGGGRLVAAITISNSEVGAGTLRIEPSVFTTWCTNLAILQAAAMRKYHVGRAWESDGNWEVFRDETREADDKAFWMKVKDVTMAAFDGTTFAAAIAQIKEGIDAPIVSKNLPKVVEVVAKKLALPQSLNGGILSALAAGGDLSRWGLSSAITYVANTHADYEVATDLERAGGKVLALTGSDWKAVAEAA